MAVVSERVVSAQPTYLPQLDGLRAVLASYVVLHHAFSQAWPPGYQVTPPLVVRQTLSWLYYGHYAVNVFIVLSGFVLTMPVVRHGGLRGGTRRFLVGRFWRIVPAYYAAIGLSVVLLGTLIGAKTGTHWDYATNLTWTTFLASVFFLHDWFGHGGVNYVFWSVAVEAKIYLLFPGIVAAWSRIGLPAVVAIVSVVALSIARLVRAWYGVAIASWETIVPWYLCLFLLGVLAGVVATSTDERWSRWRRIPWGWVCVVGSLGLIGLGYWKGTVGVFHNMDLADLVVGVVAGCGLISIVSQPGWVARILATRPLVFVGTFAYSMYLIHAAGLQLVHQYLIFPWKLTREVQFAALVGVGYPLIVLASYGFFKLFEQPFLPRRRVEAEAIAIGARSPSNAV